MTDHNRTDQKQAEQKNQIKGGAHEAPHTSKLGVADQGQSGEANRDVNSNRDQKSDDMKRSS